MVKRLPPEEGGAPNPEFDGAGAPNPFEEPNPDGGNPTFGVAGEAGCDPNMNEVLAPILKFIDNPPVQQSQMNGSVVLECIDYTGKMSFEGIKPTPTGS